MKKKKIILWSAIVGAIISLIVICTLVFMLNTVEYQVITAFDRVNRSRLFTSTKTKSKVEENLYKSAKFKKGTNLLFIKFDNNISLMEKSEPFVKIEKIVRRFPNKITVYYSEREAVSLLPVKNVDNAYFVVDSELKILDYVTIQEGESAKSVINSEFEYNLPIVDYMGLEIEGDSSLAGSFINNSTLKNYLSVFVSSIYSAIGQKQLLLEDVMQKITNIKFYNVEESDAIVDTRCSFDAVCQNGTSKINFDVFDINNLMFNKVSYAYKVFIDVFDQDYSESAEKKCKVYEDKQKDKIVVADVSNESEYSPN